MSLWRKGKGIIRYHVDENVRAYRRYARLTIALWVFGLDWVVCSYFIWKWIIG